MKRPGDGFYRRKYHIPLGMGHRRQCAGDGFMATPARIPVRASPFTRDSRDRRGRCSNGEFLINAPGAKNVVAGVRTPEPVAELKKQMPKAFAELEVIRKNLETHFKDVQDFEFTIEDGVVVHAPDPQRQTQPAWPPSVSPSKWRRKKTHRLADGDPPASRPTSSTRLLAPVVRPQTPSRAAQVHRPRGCRRAPEPPAGKMYMNAGPARWEGAAPGRKGSCSCAMKPPPRICAGNDRRRRQF